MQGIWVNNIHMLKIIQPKQAKLYLHFGRTSDYQSHSSRVNKTKNIYNC